MARIGADPQPGVIDVSVNEPTEAKPALPGAQPTHVKPTSVWSSSATSASRLRPVSELLSELSALSLDPDERLAIVQAGLEAKRTGKPLEGFLRAPLANKRAEVMSKEADALEVALAMSKRDPRALDTLVDKISAQVSATGIDPSPRASLDRLVTLLDAEHWAPVGHTTFTIEQTLQRAQGVATDETGGLYFSGNYSLSRTEGPDGPTSKPLAIPKQLSALGANHIGDVDVANGTLYAPIEDGPGYKHPFIGLYDAKTLELRRVVPLPRELQPDGVPYVAVDAKSGTLYSSSYEDPTTLNLYDLNDDDLKPLRQLELSRSLHHVQGAVVKNGMLYATCDDEEKGIYKVNLRTGTAMKVAQLGPGNREIEGIAVSVGSKGPTLLVLSIENNKGTFFDKLRKERAGLTTMELDQPSRRDQLLNAP